MTKKERATYRSQLEQKLKAELEEYVLKDIRRFKVRLERFHVIIGIPDSERWDGFLFESTVAVQRFDRRTEAGTGENRWFIKPEGHGLFSFRDEAGVSRILISAAIIQKEETATSIIGRYLDAYEETFNK